MLKELSDNELMQIVQSGDTAPAAELFDRYSGRVYNFAYRFLRNAEAAEDATQDVFMKMIRYAKQFNSQARFGTWLLAICGNHCRDMLRRNANHGTKESEEVLLSLPATSHEYNPERKLQHEEHLKMIEKGLAAATPEQQEAILLVKYQGLSYVEAAQVMGCSEGAAKTRVFRGLEAMRLVLLPDAPAEPVDAAAPVAKIRKAEVGHA